jgi:outer membrane receptor protein involved in Fe transport
MLGIRTKKIGILLLLYSINAIVCETIQAQQQAIRLSIDVQEQSLKSVLDLITVKTGVSFSYNPKKISINEKLTFRYEGTLAEVMDALAEKTKIEFEFIENQIVLKPRKSSEKQKQAHVTYSGYLKDADTGEPLIGATIYIKELATGAISNPFGFFSITVPPGVYTITSTFLGFEPITKFFELKESMREDLMLKQSPSLLQEVVVSTTTSTIPAGRTEVKPAVIEERPAYLGETDIIKSLESIPGIKMHSDGSTFYYVRGGNRDQNYLLIDDAPVYNPSHLLGFFSTLIPDAINDVTLYKGDMPASLGGRLSSVLDVRTKKGNDQHFQLWGNISLLSTKLGVEGPFKKDKSSYLLSLRTSRLRWLGRAIQYNVDRFNFYDLNAKVNVAINNRNRIYFSFYNGGDNYFDDNTGISWSNTATSFKWNYLISDRLFMNTTLAVGGYDYFLHQDVSSNTKWNSHISNFNLKSDLSYFINPDNEVTFGLGFNAHGFNPGNVTSNKPVPEGYNVSVKNSLETVLYANHQLKVNDNWDLTYGLRYTSWTNTGEAFEIIYDESHNAVDTLSFVKGESYKTYNNFEPRIGLSYSLNQNESLKASYARHVQNVHLISNSASPFTSLEVWLPSSINIKPQVAKQFSLGYYRTNWFGQTDVSVEGFFKKLSNQIDYESHAETLLNTALEGELRFGTGKAWGIELVCARDIGKFRGNIGYTFSRARRNFEEINNGKTFNAFYDRPHQINVALNYSATSRWNLGMTWVYSTGAPYSAPVSFFLYNGQEVPVYEDRNNARLPDYHRMDLSAIWRLNKNREKKWQHSLSFSIYNVYGRKNILFVNFHKTQTKDEFRIPANLMEQSRVTSEFYLFHFTPSIGYNFKWL